MNDFITSIKATLYDRISNPFISSFIFSFVIVNYDIFILLFSNVEYVDKIRELRNIIHPAKGTALFHLVVYPYVAAVFFTFIFPKINERIQREWFLYQSRLVELKQDSLKLQRLTVEDSSALMEKLDATRKYYHELMSQHSESLKAAIDKSSEDSAMAKQAAGRLLESEKNVSDQSKVIAILQGEKVAAEVSATNLNGEKISIGKRVASLQEENNSLENINRSLRAENAGIREELFRLREMYNKRLQNVPPSQREVSSDMFTDIHWEVMHAIYMTNSSEVGISAIKETLPAVSGEQLSKTLAYLSDLGAVRISGRAVSLTDAGKHFAESKFGVRSEFLFRKPPA